MQLAVSGGQMTIPGAIFATVVLPVVTMTRNETNTKLYLQNLNESFSSTESYILLYQKKLKE
jgi:hypothetical protein